LKLQPQNAEASNNLGVALQKSGRLAEAMNRFRQALQIKPEYSEAWFNLASALLESGDADQARDAAKKALRYAQAQGQANRALRIQNWLRSHSAPSNAPTAL
jgi:Flp pilus assembly protein TadD